MPNFNKVFLSGHLTDNVLLRNLPSGTPTSEFGLAVNRKWKDKDGNVQEDTLFIQCKSFGDLASRIKEYFFKGKAIFVEGALRLERWQDDQGVNHRKHVIIVQNFMFQDAKKTNDQTPAAGQANSERDPSDTSTVPPPPPAKNPDDITNPTPPESADIPF